MVYVQQPNQLLGLWSLTPALLTQHTLHSEVCCWSCVNDEEKSGVVVDISCVFRIILNSVTEGQKAFPHLSAWHASPVCPNSPPNFPGKFCFNLIG